jgi:hypothetical protein
LLTLVQNRLVQQAIDVTDQQAASIARLADESRGRSAGIRYGSLSMSRDERERNASEARARREEQTEEIRAKLAGILSSVQLQRLGQISIQLRGVSALRDPNVATALGLTEDQRTELDTVDDKINGLMRSHTRELFRSGNGDGVRQAMETIRKQADEELVAVLTTEQKLKFEELKGEPFQMPDDGESPPTAAKPIESAPIHSGFLIVDGRYVPPPYVIKQRGDDVFVNGHLILAERTPKWSPQPGWRPPATGPGWQGGAGRWGWNGGQRRTLLFSWSERRLQSNSLLFVLQDNLAGFVPADDAIEVLDILFCDATSEQKTRALADAQVGPFSSTQWAKIAASFQPTPDLTERIRQRKEENARSDRENRAACRRIAILNSVPIRYGVTVAALVLGVIALGSLLNHRPKSRARWSEIDRNGDGVRMAIRNIVLLAVLSVFDLALTLLAEQAGGFLELNPLATNMDGNPIYLASFKITVLCACCLVLAVLSKYRGAQTASWWLCLVCTILTFRWLTFNSMFLI